MDQNAINNHPGPHERILNFIAPSPSFSFNLDRSFELGGRFALYKSLRSADCLYFLLAGAYKRGGYSDFSWLMLGKVYKGQLTFYVSGTLGISTLLVLPKTTLMHGCDKDV